jgi:hypothetical protein
MTEETIKREAVATVTAPSCPIQRLDCLSCKYFQSFDPDNVGEYVVLCNHQDK